MEAIDGALNDVGISHADRMRIYKTLAAILHLGNVIIEEDILSEKCKISQLSKNHLEHAADLLNIDQQILETALLTRSIEVAGTDQIT